MRYMNVIPSLITFGGYRPTLNAYLAARHLYVISFNLFTYFNNLKK